MKTRKNRPNKGIKQVCNKDEKIVDLCIQQCEGGGVKNDSLAILLKKCEGELEVAKEQVRILTAKRDNLILLQQESEKILNPQSEPDKYRNVGLTDAVLGAVNDLWQVRRFGAMAGQIKDHLLAHGFKASENFETAIYTVLKRLSDDRRIVMEENPPPKKYMDGMSIKIVPGRKIYKPNI